MGFVAFLFVGLIAGWLANKLVKGHGIGLIGDTLVGIIGALIGGYLFDSAGVTTYGFWGSVGVSAVGAILFLFLGRLFSIVFLGRKK